MNNKNKFFILVLATVILMPVFAFGATIKAGEEVTINKGNDIKDNLYISGGNVSINSIVFGDLFTAGGNIIVSGNVSEDTTAAGGTITILGNSGGDVRVAGGNILIAGDVNGEVIATGGSVTISSDSSIKKDLVIAGGQISIDGDVYGDTQIAGGVATINGYMKGNITADVNEALTIGEGAIIDGNLEYSARKAEALKISEGAIVTGEIVFKESKYAHGDKSKNFIFAFIGVAILLKLATLILGALILVWLFRNFSNSVIKGALKNPLQKLGKGFVVLVVVPVASIILLATLFGAPFGFMAMLAYGLLICITCLYTGVVAGVWANQVINKTDKTDIAWKIIVGGVVLLTAVKLVPFIGWIIGFIVFLITLGSIAHIVHKKLWGER